MRPTLQFCRQLRTDWRGLFALVAAGLLCGGPAQAGKAASQEFKPDLRFSAYEPTKTRDPFGGKAASSAVVSTGASVFQLQGILFDAKNPTAIVNNQLVSLNKPVKVPVGASEVEVKAVEMTRGKVVLEVGEQRVELRLSAGDDGAKPTGK